MAYITLKNVTFQYEFGHHLVLNGIDLSINKGEYVVITGKTGSGKSTLSYCLNGLIPNAVDGDFTGDVIIDGHNTKMIKLSDLSKMIGIVFQNPESQIYGLSVEEDLLFALENFGYDKETIQKRITWALDVVGMTDYMVQSPFSLSGGQKQRVIIASVLALQPDIIVLDEPTAEIDPEGKSEILGILKKLNQDYQITVILFEHEMERVIQYASRMIVLDHGKIAFDDTPHQVYQHVDALRGLGVRIPHLCELFDKMKKKGLYQGAIPIDIQEAETIIRRMLT